MEPRRPQPTPCIHVCELDPANGLCLGCHRTADEICAWPGDPGRSAFSGSQERLGRGF